MRDIPTITQVALMGQIKDRPGRIFCWTFELTVYSEYGSSDQDGEVEAEVTCGAADNCYGEMIAQAQPGDWVTLGGKLRSGGFVQIVAMCVLPTHPNEGNQ